MGYQRIWNIFQITSLQVPAIFDAELFEGYDNLLLDGHIGEMVYQGVQQDDFEFRTGRCTGEHNVRLKISWAFRIFNVLEAYIFNVFVRHIYIRYQS